MVRDIVCECVPPVEEKRRRSCVDVREPCFLVLGRSCVGGGLRHSWRQDESGVDLYF